MNSKSENLEQCLICPICLELPNENAILLIPCGHTFCSTCLDKVQGEKCSLCRVKFSAKIKNYMFNQIADYLKLEKAEKDVETHKAIKKSVKNDKNLIKKDKRICLLNETKIENSHEISEILNLTFASKDSIYVSFRKKNNNRELYLFSGDLSSHKKFPEEKKLGELEYFCYNKELDQIGFVSQKECCIYFYDIFKDDICKYEYKEEHGEIGMIIFKPWQISSDGKNWFISIVQRENNSNYDEIIILNSKRILMQKISCRDYGLNRESIFQEHYKNNHFSINDYNASRIFEWVENEIQSVSKSQSQNSFFFKDFTLTFSSNKIIINQNNQNFIFDYKWFQKYSIDMKSERIITISQNGQLILYEIK